jgi:hypothetical protein
LIFQRKSVFTALALALVGLVWASICVGQTAQVSATSSGEHSWESQSSENQAGISGATSGTTSGGTSAGEQVPGNISGTILDQSGAVVTGAHVKLTGEGENRSLKQEVPSGNNGQFAFPNVAPGAFELIVTAPGFATKTSSGTVHSGESVIVPQIALEVASNLTEVEVGLSQTEVAEEQIKVEEKQRVLGMIPNFYVTYDPHAVALTSKQKFQLASRMVVDPVTFLFVGGAAGVEQAENHFAGYGQGAQGYAKRFAAGYADTAIGTYIGAAILPSILKQDPRYFYKGTGTMRARFFYAIANSLICKGDNGKWQPNYSNVLGSLAAGGISNLYYPEQDRDGAELTIENATIGIGATAISNLFQEFILRRITPKASNKNPGTDPTNP